MRPSLVSLITLLAAAVPSVASAQAASYGQYLLVLDDSGSMDESDPQRLVEMAALAFVGALEDGDQVMLAGLNQLASGEVSGPAFSSPRVLLEGRDGPEGTREVGATLRRLEAHGGQTPCHDALSRAQSILNAMAAGGAPQTLLLLTDGACNGGAVEPAQTWLSGLRTHREGRFRFVPLMRAGVGRVDPTLAEYARLTSWSGEAEVSFDARSLLRAFAEVLSFSRGLLYDDGGRVGLERTFAGARTVRVLAIHEQGTPRIALERVERGASSVLTGGPTYRHPQYAWALRATADAASPTPYAVRSPTAGAEVLVVPVYGRLRTEAVVGPCGEPPELPWNHERTVRAGQPACAWARLVGDTGETIHPHRSFEFGIDFCRDEECGDASAMQAGDDGTFHSQLGAEIPLGRHERTFRAAGEGMAVPVTVRRGFSAVSFGIHRVALADAPAQPIQQVVLGTLPKPVSDDVQLVINGAFPADAQAAIRCTIDGDDAVQSCLSCAVENDHVALTDPFRIQLTIRATTFCPAVSEGDGRELPVQLRAVIQPDGEMPEHAIPIRATLRYATAAPVSITVEGGSRSEASVEVPGPMIQDDISAVVTFSEDDLTAGELEETQRLRANEARVASLELFAEATDCCGHGAYEGTLTLTAASGGPALTLPLTVTVTDPGFWVCPGQQIATALVILLLLAFLIWLIRGFLSPAKFREGAILSWASSHEALLRLRDGDEGYRKLERFVETKRGFRRPAALHLGGPRAPLPSLKRLPADARIEATIGGGASLVVTGPGIEKFEESSGWTELSPGTHTVSSRITLRRGEETYLQFRR